MSTVLISVSGGGVSQSSESMFFEFVKGAYSSQNGELSCSLIRLLKRLVFPLKYMGIKLGPKLSQSSLDTLRLRIFKIY